MNDKNNTKNKRDIFQKIPRVVRLKKSVLLSVIVTGSILALIIVSYLPSNNVQSTSEDTLENEVENTHWLSSNTINRPQKSEAETQQLVEKNTNEQQSENQLIIKKSQEQQLREALDKIDNSKNNGESNFGLDQKKESPNNAPINVTFQNSPPNNQIEPKLADSLSVSSSNDVLSAGSFIPIIFLTEVNSELSGYALVQVSRNIYNSNRRLIIPQGSKLLLQYDSADTESERLACKSASLTLTNGKTITITDFPAIDLSGRTGLKDQSNPHYIKNFFAIAGNIATNQASTVAASQLSQMKHTENISPFFFNNQSNYFLLKKTTFYIRPGFEGNLLVTHDLVIQQ